MRIVFEAKVNVTILYHSLGRIGKLQAKFIFHFFSSAIIECSSINHKCEAAKYCIYVLFMCWYRTWLVPEVDWWYPKGLLYGLDHGQGREDRPWRFGQWMVLKEPDENLIDRYVEKVCVSVLQVHLIKILNINWSLNLDIYCKQVCVICFLVLLSLTAVALLLSFDSYLK